MKETRRIYDVIKGSEVINSYSDLLSPQERKRIAELPSKGKGQGWIPRSNLEIERLKRAGIIY